MTLKLAKPAGAKLVFRKELPVDADAAAYIAAVEAADGQTLESGVKFAVTNFVLCCKQDGIWDAIKASCILAGARTLSGALVPLKGTAPTNNNFVSGDYNRKTGLVGNGTTKYLNTNTDNALMPQNSFHLSCYVSALVGTGALMGNDSSGRRNTIYSPTSYGLRSGLQSTGALTGSAPTFAGASRSSSSIFRYRAYGAYEELTNTSSTVATGIICTHCRNAVSTGVSVNSFTTSRLAFYSIGEALDIDKLDARVTDLINAFGAAIP